MSQARVHTARSPHATTIPAAINAFGPQGPFVDILGVRFPLLDQATAVRELVDGVRRGDTRAVAFPDMSTMNIAAEDTDFRYLAGIPIFVGRCLLAQVRSGHVAAPEVAR